MVVCRVASSASFLTSAFTINAAGLAGGAVRFSGSNNMTMASCTAESNAAHGAVQPSPIQRDFPCFWLVVSSERRCGRDGAWILPRTAEQGSAE